MAYPKTQQFRVDIFYHLHHAIKIPDNITPLILQCMRSGPLNSFLKLF